MPIWLSTLRLFCSRFDHTSDSSDPPRFHGQELYRAGFDAESGNDDKLKSTSWLRWIDRVDLTEVMRTRIIFGMLSLLKATPPLES